MNIFHPHSMASTQLEMSERILESARLIYILVDAVEKLEKRIEVLEANSPLVL